MPEPTPSLTDAVEFAANPEPRCPCVLLLDTSGLMEGSKIDALNQGLHTLSDDLNKNSLAKRRVEVAVVTFDSEIKVIQDFVTADQFQPPKLTAQGLTHMAGGVLKALDMIKARKAVYKANGVSHYRPWVFMITDGEPQGEGADLVRQAGEQVKQAEQAKRVCFFAVGVENANMQKLGEISVRAPLLLRDVSSFAELFVWLSNSMSVVSQQVKTDEIAPLPPPGWAAA